MRLALVLYQNTLLTKTRELYKLETQARAQMLHMLTVSHFLKQIYFVIRQKPKLLRETSLEN